MPDLGAANSNPKWKTGAGEIRATLDAANRTKLAVRLLEFDHIAALQRFNAGLSGITRAVFLPHAYDETTLQRYVERNQRGEDRIYVLCDGREIVGYFFLWEFDHAVPLLGIGLAERWQGQRLGERMIQLLIDDARAANRDAIELTTVPGNARAFRLYQRMGFQHVGDVDNVAGDGRVVREHRMFLPLKCGVQPAERQFQPPAM